MCPAAMAPLGLLRLAMLRVWPLESCPAAAPTVMAQAEEGEAGQTGRPR
jgi:hypothetical protein